MVLVYLSAPIIHPSLRRDDFCSTVIKVLENKGIRVFAPQLLQEKEPKLIFKRDVEYVRLCDFLIAEISSPSLGVGMEIMLAIDLMKPVLLFHQSDSGPISKMVMGADGKVLFEYTSLIEVDKILHSLNLENLIVQKCTICDSQVAEVLEDEIRCVSCGHSDYDIVV
ncbi:MAG: nucleoside 2-deoxyribosyltransferase [Candidatus Odinarchaeota archaeon]